MRPADSRALDGLKVEHAAHSGSVGYGQGKGKPETAHPLVNNSGYRRIGKVFLERAKPVFRLFYRIRHTHTFFILLRQSDAHADRSLKRKSTLNLVPEIYRALVERDGFKEQVAGALELFCKRVLPDCASAEFFNYSIPAH